MPFGCPYPKGSAEAKQYMAHLRAMRGQKGGKSTLRKNRSRSGGSSLGSFFKRFVSAIKNPENREGDLRDRFRKFSNDMSGVSEVKEQRAEIMKNLNRRQRDLLRSGRWISATENGLPYEYFIKMTPNPPSNNASGGAIPMFLVKLIGKLGIAAALKYWDKMSDKAKENAWRGGAWLGSDGEIHSTGNPMLIGATRRRGGANPILMNRPAPTPIQNKYRFRDEEIKKILDKYAKNRGGKSIKDWVRPESLNNGFDLNDRYPRIEEISKQLWGETPKSKTRKPLYPATPRLNEPEDPLSTLAEAQRKEREWLKEMREGKKSSYRAIPDWAQMAKRLTSTSAMK